MGRGKSHQLGEKAPASGQYQIIGRGGKRGPEMTIVKCEPFHETPKPGSMNKIVDKTKTKR